MSEYVNENVRSFTKFLMSVFCVQVLFVYSFTSSCKPVKHVLYSLAK